MDLQHFLNTVITTGRGYFCLAYIPADDVDKYKEEWFEWPTEYNKIESRIGQLTTKNNVYFSPYLFSEKQSKKEFVLPTKTIVADLDEANALTLPIEPTILVETSHGRHQGYWVLRSDATNDVVESYARRLTYAIPRCDLGGWYLGKRLRLPGTFNYKYKSGIQEVKIVGELLNKHSDQEFEHLPVVLDKGYSDDDLEWVSDAENYQVGPQEVLALFQQKLTPKVVATYDIQAQDRSEALWALMVQAFRAGATREQVYVLGKGSANNKFSDLKFGGVRELAKDVLRAEAAVHTNEQDLIAKIASVRSLPGSATSKRAFLSKIVKEELLKIGRFIHSTDGSVWYIKEDIGRPISVSQNSEHLLVMLNVLLGLNSTEVECKYVIASLFAYGKDLPPTSTVAYLSYYDTDTSTLLVHTGGRDVLRVTKDAISSVVDGYNGIVFPWQYSSYQENLLPRYDSLERPWYEEVFGDCLDNLLGMEKEEALCLLRVWTIMIIMREAIVSKPILALFGQPGSGKSTLFRRVYAFLYGRGKSLNSVTRPDDFDYAVSTDPLVVLDNVDTYERWLPDRLALSASRSEIMKRKLYTDNDVVTLVRQAFVGITAHNPRFGREDVTDRLVLLNFERLQSFKPEMDIIEKILKLRNSLWGGILVDIQNVLRTEKPHKDSIPQFRIEDFAYLGYWIASAIGVEDVFTSAINTLRKDQKSFLLEEDGILMTPLERLINTSNDKIDHDEYYPSGWWWSKLEMLAQDPKVFKVKYGNAVSLGRKFWTLQEALKQRYDVSWKLDSKTGSRVWRIRNNVEQQ